MIPDFLQREIGGDQRRFPAQMSFTQTGKQPGNHIGVGKFGAQIIYYQQITIIYVLLRTVKVFAAFHGKRILGECVDQCIGTEVQHQESALDQFFGNTV